MTVTARRRIALPALTAAAALLFGGCAVVDSERPDEVPSVSPETITPVPTPEDFSQVPIVDVSPGGAEDTDFVWQGLAAAVEQEREAYLHAWIRTSAELPEDGETALTPEFPDSVSLTVPVEAVTVSEDDPAMKLIEGTFAVEQIGTSAFVLTGEDTEAHEELHPQGPDDAARCTAEDGNERIQAASQNLATALVEDDAAAREELRLQWAAAPAVWWGIQRTAIDLAASDQESAGDFLLEACAPHLED
ncbi:hypothetical protein [Brevibacterium album]|uniref:hypothetical protein n=1 Tax=Brevibacterium album TaxID=417948 RepID=UPI00040F8692|nr:hypothetical protein [Brevibacterium album]